MEKAILLPIKNEQVYIDPVHICKYHMNSNDAFAKGSIAFDSGRFLVAFELMTTAAELGNVSAMTTLGVYFFDGIGTEKNRGKGFMWSRRAVNKGDSCAAINIAVEYLSSSNMDRARYWLNRAHMMGDEGALFYLGKININSVSSKQRRIGYCQLTSIIGTRFLSSEQNDEARYLIASAGINNEGKED